MVQQQRSIICPGSRVENSRSEIVVQQQLSTRHVARATIGCLWNFYKILTALQRGYKQSFNPGLHTSQMRQKRPSFRVYKIEFASQPKLWGIQPSLGRKIFAFSLFIVM